MQVLFMYMFVLGLACKYTQAIPVNFGCNLPPSKWCDNLKTAQACEVVSQCKRFVWLEQDQNRVNFTLYMESLCPDCKNFIKEQLGPTWNKIGDIINLELVPYGNAKERFVNDSKWVFECQHGTQECIGNQIQTCAIHSYPETKEHFPFVLCMESKDLKPGDDITSLAKQCALTSGLDFSKISKCAKSPWGNLLEHKMAEKTEKLNPPHKYVPWVTVNGVHTEDMQQKAQSDLLKLLCDTYKGKKPTACDM